MATNKLTLSGLRKKPKSWMGLREKAILMAKSAKLTKARDYKDCYKVKAGDKYFAFTYGKPGYKDFTIIN